MKYFGLITNEEERKMIKRTFGYKLAILADAVADLKRVTLESVKGIIKRNRG